MFGNYWWCSLLELAAFITINVIVIVFLRGKYKPIRGILYTIGTYLVIAKFYEYGSPLIINGTLKLPLDYSAVSYFLFGLAVFIPNRIVKVVATSAALTAGAIYNIAFIIFPEQFVVSSPSDVAVFVYSACNHSLLYFGSLLSLSTITIKKIDYAIVPLGFALVVGYAYLGAAIMGSGESATTIFDIADGTIFCRVIDGFAPSVGFYFIYYPACVAVMLFIVWLMRRLNRILFCAQKSDNYTAEA